MLFTDPNPFSYNRRSSTREIVSAPKTRLIGIRGEVVPDSVHIAVVIVKRAVEWDKVVPPSPD
jgi:hypothetical protein